ncbi:MAG: ArsC/Spx/MgsR family protein [Magnetospiraceae bacterium]
MTRIDFYEKPGCINNTKQKALLRDLGYEVEVRDLLRWPWTVQSLQPFFGDRPVKEWFNASAPRVKSGEVDPASLDAATALALMVEDPLLIRRPLMETDLGKISGFVPGPALLALGIDMAPPKEDLETCPRTHAENMREPVS